MYVYIAICDNIVLIVTSLVSETNSYYCKVGCFWCILGEAIHFLSISILSSTSTLDDNAKHQDAWKPTITSSV